MSFLRARSPVTPNTTSAHGSGTRGSRRSRGSRSGFVMRPPATRAAGFAGSYEWAAGRVEQLAQPGGAVGQVQPQHRPLPRLERLQVTEGLGELQPAEGERLTGDVEIGVVDAGHLQEHPDLRTALVVL